MILSDELFKSQEETSLKVYEKVLVGFKETSGRCKDYIHDMGVLAVSFFNAAKKMEESLAKADAEAFREAICASKGHVCGLIEEVAEAEHIYNQGEARFDSILASVAEEVKAFIHLEGERQRKHYMEQSLARIKQDHGRLDATTFIPMIIGNMSTHRALVTNQRVAHSQIPLKIMQVPLRTQAGSVKIYLRFLQFVAGRVFMFYERLGPNAVMIPLESEPGQSTSPSHQRSSSPSKRSSPAPSRHSSPAHPRCDSPVRTDPEKKVPVPAAAGASAPNQEPVSSMKLWEDLHLSDEDVEDRFTDDEDPKSLIPLPTPGKHPHPGSDDEKSAVKKTKLDIADLYGAVASTSDKGAVAGTSDKGADGTKEDEGITAQDGGATRADDGAMGAGIKDTGAGGGDTGSKSPKHKKSKKKKKKHNKDKKDEDKEGDKKDKESTGGDQATPLKKTPEKAEHPQTGDESSEATSKTPSKKKPIRSLQECRWDKWASTTPLAIRYRQRRAISVHQLSEGCNYDDHTDYIRQLMCQESLGVNIKSLDDRIKELKGLMSAHHKGLCTALKDWKDKHMGKLGVTPQYVIKAFVEPVSQRKIVKRHDDH